MNSMSRHPLETFKLWLDDVEYPGLNFEIHAHVGYFYLQVVCPNGSCNVTGEDYTWKGRKWLLSVHMTKGEFVQTCLMAVLTALEHEAREKFKYKGQSVFDPHYDIDSLHALRATDPIIERS